MIPKVSVIIATKDRFAQLEQAVNSVLKQTYSNIEIIIINDGSVDPKYSSDNWMKGVANWIDLEVSSKDKFGYASPGFVRHFGITKSTGNYISILDDDDYFLPTKIEKQISSIINSNYKLCATEGLMGNSFYTDNKYYPKYHIEFYKDFCLNFFAENNMVFNGALPSIFDKDLISRHNFIIHSSVVYDKLLYYDVGGYSFTKYGREDWDLFLAMLDKSKCIYINEPLVYYDGAERSLNLNSSKMNRNFTRKLFDKVLTYFNVSSQNNII